MPSTVSCRPPGSHSVVTVISAAILIGAEVFGAAFAGGWALAILFGLSDTGAHVLQAVLFTVGVSLGAAPLLHAVAGPDAAAAAAPYAWWLFGVGAVPAWWTNTLASVLRGGGQHALVARIQALQWLALPLLAWGLAEPLGFGLTGVGAAFAAVNGVAALAMLRVVRQGQAGFVPHWRAPPQRVLFVRILQVGAVASGLAALSNLTTIIVTAQLRHLGPTAVLRSARTAGRTACDATRRDRPGPPPSPGLQFSGG